MVKVREASTESEGGLVGGGVRELGLTLLYISVVLVCSSLGAKLHQTRSRSLEIH